MINPFEQAAINLAVAVALGAVIGFERQRSVGLGLQTNTLVAMGAASFEVFAKLTSVEVAPQVVSGIGFLCTGLVFREGLTVVRGLNTAATLWCSAAIGILAGAGQLAHATLATGFVVSVNLLIIQIINRFPSLTSTEL